MFYSQFILAKKGPLGTIWVAAHLERKLRKNQVADTDIGDSVDSIITPEVPIALRLSSHLLLGVVRIYSRKVNYLFDDCSETLLKVKQAFRAADVDLPPEETTAPYESITLPETFDLDDFELPDNEIFQGNQVDHHTSTMDQITLQDNMEGVVYSGSQFGLDDTFGDGENSSLNFDEGLDLHKVDSTDHSAASSSHQVSAHVAPPKQDEGSIEMPANNESMIENLDLERDVRDYAQAPSTPGVVETPNIANVHEISACEDHMDDDDNHPLVVSVTNEIPETISGKSDHCQENAQPGLKSVDDKDLITVEENGNQLFDLNVEKRFDSSDVGVQNISTDDPEAASRTFFSVADEAQALGQAPNSTKVQDLENMNLESDGVNGPSVSVEDHGERSRVISNERAQDASFSISSLHLPIGINDIDVSGNPNRPISTNGTLDLNFEHTDLSSIEKPEDVHVFNGAVFDERPRTQLHTLRPYMTGLELANDLDMSHIVGANPRECTGGGERFHGSGPAVVVQDNAWQHNPNENHTARGLIEDFQTGFGESYNQINNVVGGDSMLKNVSGPLGVIASAPEKQLPVIDAHYDQPPEKQLPVLDARYNQPKDLQEDTRMFNRAILDEMPRTQLRRPPRTGSELADSSHNMAPGVSTIPQKSHGGGEWIYASGPAVVVQDDALEHKLNKNHTAAPRSIEDIHAGYGKSYNQGNNAVGGDSMLKNVSGSVGAGFSAPENLMSVPYVYNNIQPRDLPEDTRMFNRPVFDEMARAQFPGGGERIHLAQPAVVLQGDVLKHNLNEKHTLGPRLSEDIHAGYGKSHSQVNNVVGGDNSMFRNVSSSFGGVIYSAPEKQLSMHSNQPRELPGVIYPAPEKQLSMHSNQPRDLPGVIYPAPEKQLSMHSNQPRDLPEDNHVFNGAVFNEMPRTQLHNLRPCRTGLEFSDSSHDMAPNVSAIPQESRGGGERIHASGPAAAAVQGPGSINDIRHGSSKTYNQVNYAAGGGDSMVRNVSGPLGAMFSAPEKLLSVPDVRNNQPRDLPVEATPRDMARLYENDASSQISSWKKRSYTESTQTEQSLNSVMSASVVSNKRPGEASPDEDYLSSILVGRGSSVLQVKSTPPPLPLPHPHHLPSPHPHHLPSPHPHHLPPPNPHHLPPPHPHHLPPPHPHHYQYPPPPHPPHHLPPPHEITSVKRQRRGPQPNAPKASANKRKVPVLMDDMLVMHGDIIRQQLINTADIRRLRRKASSTRPENSVIIKLSLEEEILGEPLCSGTSVVLASLFSHSYNINRIKVSKDDGVSAISSSDKRFESVNESIHNIQRDTRYRGEYESVKENTDMHLNEVVLLTENKSDADNEVSVGLGVTNKKLDPTENKEIENEGVGAEASMEMKTEAVLSHNAVIGSKNVSLNNSLFGNGSERNVNDVRLDMVKSGDMVTVNEVESNDNDTRGSKNAMLGTMSGDVVNEVESNERDDDVLLDGDDQCADTVETERLHSEQAQHDDDACGPSTEKKNDDASKGINNEPLCGGGKSGGSTLVASLYPPGFGTSGESTPVVASLYPPGFETSSGSSPVAASSYPPGFGTSSGSSPVVASSCPPGFGTSDGSPPVVTSSYPPGFSTADGSAPVVTADGSESVVTADGSAPVVTADGSASVVTADGSAPVVTADGSAPVATADGSAPVATADGSAPVATVDGSTAVVTSYPPGFGNVEDSVIDDKKSPIQEDVNPTNTVSEESSDPDTQDYYDDINDPDDPDDPDDADDTGFDTGFLNDDDDDDDYEVAEVADDDEPNGEATRITDNSGWSSRTRAVANYLQTVFMREVEYDKKVVPINDLLVGKTRKEACRMFFETLVLKTKDYVQVEQEGPFENIKVKPKMKLLKSEF